MAGYSLKRICNETQWRKNVYLTMSYIEGGLSNLRNSYMSLIRRAIDAGLGVVMPNFHTRQTIDLKHYNSGETNFTYLFDYRQIKAVFAEHCPQLDFRDTTEGSKTVMTVDTGWTKKFFRGQYRSVINNLLGKEEIGLTLIRDTNPFFGWLFSSEVSVDQVFYNAVQYRKDIRSLAKPILASIHSKFIGFHLRVEKDQWCINPMNC
jgi:uncharacterized ubiquitin-like protein YukD